MSELQLTVAIGRIIGACVLFTAAGVLAYFKREGWGWCLFLGILLMPWEVSK